MISSGGPSKQFGEGEMCQPRAVSLLFVPFEDNSGIRSLSLVSLFYIRDSRLILNEEECKTGASPPCPEAMPVTSLCSCSTFKTQMGNVCLKKSLKKKKNREDAAEEQTVSLKFCLGWKCDDLIARRIITEYDGFQYDGLSGCRLQIADCRPYLIDTYLPR